MKQQRKLARVRYTMHFLLSIFGTAPSAAYCTMLNQSLKVLFQNDFVSTHITGYCSGDIVAFHVGEQGFNPKPPHERYYLQ